MIVSSQISMKTVCVLQSQKRYIASQGTVEVLLVVVGNRQAAGLAFAMFILLVDLLPGVTHARDGLGSPCSILFLARLDLSL